MTLTDREQVSMSRLSSIRTFNSPYGMLVGRTRSDLCGGIISRTPKASFSLLIVTIVNEWSRLVKSCNEC